MVSGWTATQPSSSGRRTDLEPLLADAPDAAVTAAVVHSAAGAGPGEGVRQAGRRDGVYERRLPGTWPVWGGETSVRHRWLSEGKTGDR